ncbi:MAG TPA: AIR synthase-related protein, partial [Polyangiaceae bacterium]|nr:AIR synthase-related protein [Polyangiaceae bacterium]
NGLGARLDLSSYERPAVFEWLARQGPIEEAEMRRTFNLGVGLCAIVEPDCAGLVLDALRAAGEHAWTLGQVVTVDPSTPFEQRVLFV